VKSVLVWEILVIMQNSRDFMEAILVYSSLHKNKVHHSDSTSSHPLLFYINLQYSSVQTQFVIKLIFFR
jgi:hypothetical protein